MTDFIPQIEPWIDEQELTQLKRVIDSTYVTEHILTEEFESLIKDLTGSKHAIAITNGTAALYCCLKALNIKAGDEVIVPNMTFIASSNSVIMAGAKPVFCEINENTFCIEPDKIEELINDRTKAIMPVHLYGQSADMTAIMKLASKHSLHVIEDAAQGVGVKFNNRHVGTFGDCGILSFYGNKTITCGEGGVILTDNDEIKERCYQLKNHGRPGKGVFKHDHIGYNFAFTEMQAAIGISQMHKLPKIIETKKEIFEYYCDKLGDLSNFISPVFIDERSQPVFWFSSFLTDSRDALVKYLKDKNIGTRIFFHPMHMQPCYDDLGIEGSFNISENIYRKGISLPSSYNLTLEQQEYIIKCVYDFFGKKV